MLKAIETVYNGYRFRSRLEARWAVFFDTLGIKYEYEREGYDLDGVRYLPDFWLPQQQCFVEIKGQQPTSDEIAKGLLLAKHSGDVVFIFSGEIIAPADNYDFCSPVPSALACCSFGDTLGSQHWAECYLCGKFDICYGGEPERLTCGCATKLLDFYQENGWKMRALGMDSPQDHTISLIAAYTAARQARFEFGEKGGTR